VVQASDNADTMSDAEVDQSLREIEDATAVAVARAINVLGPEHELSEALGELLTASMERDGDATGAAMSRIKPWCPDPTAVTP
jgi:hypothetical protein